MKLINNNLKKAFTLVEVMTSVAVFSFLMLGVVYFLIWLLKYDELACSKIGASDAARKGFDLLVNDIRSAKVWNIGNGNSSSFTPIGNGTNQVGNAIQIYSQVYSSNYTRYYFDTNAGTLSRVTYSNQVPLVLANYLTNTMTFSGETFNGTIVNTYTYRYVVHATMQFAQYQYPLTRVGNGFYFTTYQMDFRVTPHCPD